MIRRYKIEKDTNVQPKSTFEDAVEITEIEEVPVNCDLKSYKFKRAVLISLARSAIHIQEMTGELPRYAYSKPGVMEMIEQIRKNSYYRDKVE